MFKINDIITIVMAQIEEIECFEKYGIEEEAYLPSTIKSKLSKLKNHEYMSFMDKIIKIAEEVRELKTGELSMLNVLHNEIRLLSEKDLGEYINKE